MLKALRLEGFKAFKDTDWIELAPLTILIGANSSGKSCLLQALLMLKQTWESRDRAVPLVTDGKYAQLGSYQAISHRHNLTGTVGIHLDMIPDARMYWGPKPHIVPKSERYQISSEFAWSSTTNTVYLKSYTLRAPQEVPILRVTAAPTGQALTCDSLAFSSRRGKRRPKIPDHPERFLERSRFCYYVYPYRRDLPRFSELLEELHFVTRNVELFLSDALGSIYYLGPVREGPRRWYHATSETPADVGLRGEATGQVLYHADALRRRVQSVLKTADIALAATVKQFGPGGRHYALQLKDPVSGLSINVADTGFGVSQVLPIIVESLHAPDGSLILAEQPEIHLHPRLQVQLAEFLLAVSADKNLIVETHSEHLLLRIQRAIAAGKVAPDGVAVYYVEPGRQQSTIRRLPLDRLGRFKEWPAGFFEEDLQEAFKLAEAQARAVAPKKRAPARRPPKQQATRRRQRRS